MSFPTKGPEGGAYYPFVIRGNLSGITPVTYPNTGPIIGTSTSGSITGNQANTVTVANIGNIQVGTVLQVWNGGVRGEKVTVTAVNRGANQFTAFFVNSYSGTTIFTSNRGSFIGAVIINTAGSGATLTLYDDYPNGSPHGANSDFATITVATTEQTRPYYAIAEYGLYCQVTGATQNPNLTVMYYDAPELR